MTSKDWTGKANDFIQIGGFSNARKHDRQQHDYYATDPRALECLLTLEGFSNVWECASGGGHLMKVLKDHGILGRYSDLYDYDNGAELSDFLAQTDKWDGDIITNPPYKYTIEFVLKALELATGKVAMWLPQRYFSSISRYEKIFKHTPPTTAYISVARISCAINGEFKGASSAVDYMWLVWDKAKMTPNYKSGLKWFLAQDRKRA